MAETPSKAPFSIRHQDRSSSSFRTVDDVGERLSSGGRGASWAGGRRSGGRRGWEAPRELEAQAIAGCGRTEDFRESWNAA